MSEIYKKIDGSKYRSIYVVGDLHGCFNRLMTELNERGFDKGKDLLVSVGDLIDRGGQSLDCLELIMEKWFVCVRGNHEQMAIDALAGNNNGMMWFHNGGDWFFLLDHYKEILAKALIAKSEQLPYVIEIETGDKKVVVAHADYPSDEYRFGKTIDLEKTIWSRERFEDLADRPSDGIKGADAFYFGHTPIQRPARSGNLNYIDTGAVFGNLLTIVQIQGDANG